MMSVGLRDQIDPNKAFPNHLEFVERSLTQFLQILFSTFPKGNKPTAYHYDATDEESEILISGRNTENLVRVDTRPKIIVTRGPQGWAQTHINNFVGAQNLSRFNQNFSSIYSGTAGINCFAREEAEADRLAVIVSDSINMFQNVIRQFGFLEIKAAQIGQRAIVKSDSRVELVVTPVLIKTQLTKNWNSSFIDAVKLRQIILQIMIKSGSGETQVI